MSGLIDAEFVVPAEHAGKRLDQSLALLCPEHSRARLSTWIKAGQVLVNGAQKQPKDKVHGGELILVQAELPIDIGLIPEDVPFAIIYEDDDIIVVNKPNDLVVHPAAGNPSGTLLNGLIYHYPEMANLPRAGIVHRLDKGTTGLMVVAKTPVAHTSLVRQIHDRAVHRHYQAIVFGEVRQAGEVCEPIGRHPTVRTKMAVVAGGKYAKTHYMPKETFSGYTYMGLKLETGRTHQIRVHMAHIKHPLLGDDLYSGRRQIPPGLSNKQRSALAAFKRPALHAIQLSFVHPTTGNQVTYNAPLPEDYEHMLASLREAEAQ